MKHAALVRGYSGHGAAVKVRDTPENFVDLIGCSVNLLGDGQMRSLTALGA